MISYLIYLDNLSLHVDLDLATRIGLEQLDKGSPVHYCCFFAWNSRQNNGKIDALTIPVGDERQKCPTLGLVEPAQRPVVQTFMRTCISGPEH